MDSRRNSSIPEWHAHINQYRAFESRLRSRMGYVAARRTDQNKLELRQRRYQQSESKEVSEYQRFPVARAFRLRQRPRSAQYPYVWVLQRGSLGLQGLSGARID